MNTTLGLHLPAQGFMHSDLRLITDILTQMENPKPAPPIAQPADFHIAIFDVYTTSVVFNANPISAGIADTSGQYRLCQC